MGQAPPEEAARSRLDYGKSPSSGDVFTSEEMPTSNFPNKEMFTDNVSSNISSLGKFKGKLKVDISPPVNISSRVKLKGSWKWTFPRW